MGHDREEPPTTGEEKQTLPEHPYTTVLHLLVVMVALLACQGQPGGRESVPDAAVFDSVVEAFKAQSSYKATIRMKGADINQLL